MREDEMVSKIMNALTSDITEIAADYEGRHGGAHLPAGVLAMETTCSDELAGLLVEWYYAGEEGL